MGSLNTVKMNQMALPGLDPVQPAIEQLATATEFRQLVSDY